MDNGKIGARIRDFRTEKGLSQEELADKAGISLDLLRTIEADEHAPALGYLLKLSRALGMRLGGLMDDIFTPDPFIVRSGEMGESASPVDGKGKTPVQDYFSLGKGKSDRHMEPFFIRLTPQDPEKSDLSTHEGEEFIIVVSGKVRLDYGRSTHELEAGDSMYYNSIVPHRVSAAGGRPAEIYAVIYVPA